MVVFFFFLWRKGHMIIENLENLDEQKEESKNE